MKQTYNHVSPAFQLVIPPLPRTLRLAFLSTAVFVYCSVLLITLGLHRTPSPWYRPVSEYTATQATAAEPDSSTIQQSEGAPPLFFPENKTVVRRLTASAAVGTVLGVEDAVSPVSVSSGVDSVSAPCGCDVASGVSAGLASRVNGRILLQVEGQGEAWYVEPVSLRAYYLADGASAFRVLSRLAMGVTDTDISSIPVGDAPEPGVEAAPGSTELIERLKGRVLLRAESLGEMWYVNPADGKRYSLSNGEAAYQVMRRLSLGITNQDLEQVTVGELEGG